MTEQIPFHERLLASFPPNSPQIRGSIDCRGLLSKLADVIKPQLEAIPRTFPEYTAHDWDNHIVSLFDIAEQIFSADALLSLNHIDRFLLTAGLYGHDWGMAVEKTEREAIAKGGKFEKQPTEIALLPDEDQQLTAFARDRGLKQDVNGGCDALLDDVAPYWPEYVRRTHAWRSGERIRRFLSSHDVDDALSDAGNAVCVGHCLGFDQLRDATRFRPLRMVATTRVHVRLIALLVRLADLFDIGRDRTPYALRRFVGPADPTSVKEWDRHAALDHIDCLTIAPDRRQIMIRGTCRKADLWPALMDLRGYLEEQLEQGAGLLAEEYRSQLMELPNSESSAEARKFYQLDSALKWEVQPEGFKPADIRFEFDRMATFRILAKEIYGHEPHVFVRELLQNAIDAIRQRRARLKHREDLSHLNSEDFLIRFHVRPDVNGRMTVTCRDYGIGMDEHIVRQYLARIGSSYYTSDEFVRERVRMDVISRFGIGLLSCFMVADKLSIRTRRPVTFGGDGAGIRIEIPGIERHFEIYPLEDPEWEGTEVRVEVLPEKLAPLLEREGSVQNFSVVRYLQRISGFVEVPIYIEEGNTRLLILHPRADPSIKPKGVADNVEIRQLRGAYRWTDELQRFVMCPDPAALSDYRVDLVSDLLLSDIEGFVSFPMPCELKGDMRILNNGLLQGESMTVQTESGDDVPSIFAKSLAFSPEQTSEEKNKAKLPSNLLYQDGVYVSGTGEIGQRVGDDPFPPHAWLNYVSSARSELTASRGAFARDPKNSPEWIVIKARTHAFHKELRTIGTLPPIQKLRKLVQIEKFLGVSNGSVVESVPWDAFPAIAFQAPGIFECITARDAFHAGFRIIPTALRESANARRVFDALGGKSSPAAGGFLGKPWLFEFPIPHGVDSVVQQSIEMLQNVFLDHALFPVALRFVTLPQPFNGPQPQEIRIPRTNTKPENVRPLMKKVLSHVSPLTAQEWARLRVGNVVDGGSEFIRRCFEFPEPFPDHFAHGLAYYNLRHPTVQWLVRIAAAVAVGGGFHSGSRTAAGTAYNAITFLSSGPTQAESCYETFSAHWRSIVQSTINLFPQSSWPSPACPGFGEFIPESMVMTKRESLERKLVSRPLDFFTNQPWGTEISMWPPSP